MNKKTLEDKIQDAHEAFENEFSSKIKSLGYYLTSLVSKVGARDSKAPEANKNEPCLVGHIKPLDKRGPLRGGSVQAGPGHYVGYRYKVQTIEYDTLLKIAREIIPNEYRGLRVFLEYCEARKPRDNVGPKPAYGVSFPPDDEPVM